MRFAERCRAEEATAGRAPVAGRAPADRAAAAVVVAHPGTQHSARVADALLRAGYLDRYLTSLIWRHDGVLGRGLGRLQGEWARELDRQLGRRSVADMGERSVQLGPALELCQVAASRAGLRRLGRHALWLRNELFDRRVAREIERRRPAAVIGYDSCALHTFAAARRVGAISVLDQTVGHIRSGVRVLREEGAHEALRAMPQWLVERCSAEAAAADFVLAPSPYVESTLGAHGIDPARIVRMPFGVDVDRFRPADNRPCVRRFRVLFVGQLSRRKGVSYLLEAFAGLEVPGAELVLVGDVTDARLPEGDGRIRARVKHVAHVPHHEVHRLFQEADVFVYPSLHEGSALAIYEALASGLPVITTFNSGSVVREGLDGFIVPIRNAAAIRDRLRALHAQAELCRAMGHRAREQATRFTWAAYRGRMEAFLGMVVSGVRPASGEAWHGG